MVGNPEMIIRLAVSWQKRRKVSEISKDEHGFCDEAEWNFMLME